MAMAIDTTLDLIDGITRSACLVPSLGAPLSVCLVEWRPQLIHVPVKIQILEECCLNCEWLPYFCTDLGEH